MKKHVLWTYEDNFNEDIKNDYERFSEDVDVSENDLWYEVYEYNQECLEDLRDELNITLEGKIIIIADLGLWSGHHYGYKIIDNNIKDCFDSEYSPIWFLDKNKDLCCEEYHHDGMNSFIYRELKSNLSEVQVDNFLDKLYNGSVTRKDITRYTNKIGNKIAEFYGI